jgi:hypothetical protein
VIWTLVYARSPPACRAVSDSIRCSGVRANIGNGWFGGFLPATARHRRDRKHLFRFCIRSWSPRLSGDRASVPA